MLTVVRDNEKPARLATVKSFVAKGRPITNKEYAEYLQANSSEKLPASWTRHQKASNGHSPSGVGGIVNGFVNGISNTLTNGNGHTSNGTNGSSHASESYHGRTDSAVSFTGVTNDAFNDVSVRTVYGPVPMKYALHWPVFASYDELAGCAAWMGGRISTANEARSIYVHAEKQKMKAEKNLGRTISAVNG